MANRTELPPAQTLRFRVLIDGDKDLGSWSKCDGLSVEYEVKEYMEGGENRFVHRIPGRIKYQNIKLTRVINADSSKVAAWVAGLRRGGKRKRPPFPRSIQRETRSPPGTWMASIR